MEDGRAATGRPTRPVTPSGQGQPCVDCLSTPRRTSEVDPERFWLEARQLFGNGTRTTLVGQSVCDPRVTVERSVTGERADLKRHITFSQTRVGWCEFSAWLFGPCAGKRPPQCLL